MCGFRLGKVEKTKKIILIKDIQDGADLEKKLVQSKIVILPLNDFPNDLPLVEDSSFSVQTNNTSMNSSIYMCQEDNNSNHLESEQISLNNSTVSQRTTITRQSRSTPMQYQTIESNFDEKEEEEEDDQLSM